MSFTSYSWESRRLSLAFSSSMCSASSLMGMGGWLIIPAWAKVTARYQSRDRPRLSTCTPQLGVENMEMTMRSHIIIIPI